VGQWRFAAKVPSEHIPNYCISLISIADFHLSAVDNIIDVTFFKSLVPKMAEKPLGEQIFYEVKSNLKEAQVKLLAEAGITLIQPGIESLSSEILGLMKKGVTGIQNIQLLKWCKQYAVRPEWNFIWGFPREPANEYARMRDLLPAISHLPPPGSAGKIRMDRFSPNFNSPEHFGFCNVRPFPSYAYVYTDLEPDALRKIAYFFSFDYADNPYPEDYTSHFLAAVREWQNHYTDQELLYIDYSDYALVVDLRPSQSENFLILRDALHWCLLECDTIKSIAQLERTVPDEFKGAPLYDAISTLVSRELLLCEDDQYLSLAISLAGYSPPAPALRKLLAEAVTATVAFKLREGGE
jgi:ribosomal peptide maturation radical SAM protein 1